MDHEPGCHGDGQESVHIYEDETDAHSPFFEHELSNSIRVEYRFRDLFNLIYERYAVSANG